MVLAVAEPTSQVDRVAAGRPRRLGTRPPHRGCHRSTRTGTSRPSGRCSAPRPCRGARGCGHRTRRPAGGPIDATPRARACATDRSLPLRRAMPRHTGLPGLLIRPHRSPTCAQRDLLRSVARAAVVLFPLVGPPRGRVRRASKKTVLGTVTVAHDRVVDDVVGRRALDEHGCVGKLLSTTLFVTRLSVLSLPTCCRRCPPRRILTPASIVSSSSRRALPRLPRTTLRDPG